MKKFPEVLEQIEKATEGMKHAKQEIDNADYRLIRKNLVVRNHKRIRWQKLVICLMM